MEPIRHACAKCNAIFGVVIYREPEKGEGRSCPFCGAIIESDAYPVGYSPKEDFERARKEEEE